MPGDIELGAMLRELRTARRLTLAAVARRVGCAESLLSYLESGRRRLHPWLADKLDHVYETGGVIALMAAGECRSHESQDVGVLHGDVLVVQLPGGGAAMPLSRRGLLAALGAGIVGNALHTRFEQALDKIQLGDDAVQTFEDAFSGFQTAARLLPPARLIDSMMGNVAILDGLRRRADRARRPRYARMQARYAESLSWLHEEAGELPAAMYWLDRSVQWAQTANWSAMTAYSFVRRSMLVMSFAGDGGRAVDQAQTVLDMSDASPRMKGLAAKQMAFGYALARDGDASGRALDTAMRLLAQPVQQDDAVLGQRSVVDDDLHAIFQTTCEVYLGRGERVIPMLEPRLASLSHNSVRTATITRAKLAHAYANAGQPEEAGRLSLETLDAVDRIGSLSARSELRRALPVLGRWRRRSDVQAVIHRLRSRPTD